jgi:hypothetical protein
VAPLFVCLRICRYFLVDRIKRTAERKKANEDQISLLLSLLSPSSAQSFKGFKKKADPIKLEASPNSQQRTAKPALHAHWGSALESPSGVVDRALGSEL